MQDPSDSMETSGPEENGQGEPAGSDLEPTDASTVIAEVLPGIAVVFGEVPAVLKPDLLDLGLVSTADHQRISTILASVGNTAAVAGGLGNALTKAQGLYRLSGATQALLRSGATLAVKDGANLGTVMFPGRIIAQARFIPVEAVGVARHAATIGPALAMVALQMQLNEVTGLVKTNIALTTQVLKDLRNEQRAELTALVATVDRTIDQARQVESVPASLWDNVAGSEALLRKQIEHYRENITGHLARIDRPDLTSRREYLHTNAEAITFDAFALLDALKAWTGYQALRVGRARTAGREDADETRLVDVIVKDTRTEFESALAEATHLVGSLTRELRILVELPGRESLSQTLTSMWKDSKATRATPARLLEAIRPLADALHPPAPALEAPEVLCAAESLELDRYLRILRCFVEDDETLRVLAFPDQLDALDPISAIIGGAKEMLAAAMDRTPARTLVAVTDRRIITAKTNAFLEQGELRQDIPLDHVRYVRTGTTQDRGARTAIDLITRDESLRWLFPADIDTTHVDALAAVLAASMSIPDSERDALLRRHPAPAPSGERDELAGPASSEPTTSETPDHATG